MLLTKIVKLKCNPNNKKHLIEKGYNWDYNKNILVKVEDLNENSKCEVDVACDYCLEDEIINIIPKKYYNYIQQNKNSIIHKDCCKKCYPKKVKEINMLKINQYSKLDIYKMVLNGELKCFPQMFWNNVNNNDISNIFIYFVNLLIKDEIIFTINDLPKILSQNLLNKYKLKTLQSRFGIFNIVNITYPNKWVPWEFNFVSSNFWNNKDNLIDVGIWLFCKLINDNVINDIEDIPNLNQNIFNSYNLKGVLASKFNYSPYIFWNTMFPSKWFEWEFKITPKNYWNKKVNRINALKQLIENRLNLNIINIPKNISYSFLVEYYHKFSHKCDIFYHSNLFKWIDEVYPNIFTPEDFNQIIASDGTKLDSNLELIIHELLIKTFKNVKYYDNNIINENKWHNELTNENYVADWLIDNNIIIEYFGWYNLNSYNKNKIITDYINKTHRKIKYFSSLKNYKFLSLFPEDLRYNLKGVKEKLKIIENIIA